MRRTGIILLTAIFAVVSFAYSSEVSDKEFDLVRSFKTSPGKKLDIRLATGGDIKISGSSEKSVVVKARFTGEHRDDLEFDVKETSSGVQVSSRILGKRKSYNANSDVEIQVPSRFDIDIETMGGDVSISNVEGNISGQTMGGELNLDSLKGDVQLTTMGGEVTVADSDLDGSVKTMGGDVLIKNVSGSMKGSTMGGDVRYENAGTTGKVRSEVKVHSMGGDLNVTEAPEGASLETMGGDIHVVSASKFVNAKTMGGDIELDSVNGSVDATTMGGDVTVRIVGDSQSGERDISLNSMGGDIELTVPANMSMNFDLEIIFNPHHSSRTPKIISDFPLKISEEDYEESRDGRTKRVIGTGQNGSGAHKVKIKTVSGDIYIKRS